MEKIVEKAFMSKSWDNFMKKHDNIIALKVFNFIDRESVILYTLFKYEELNLISTTIINDQITEENILSSIDAESVAFLAFESKYPATYLKNYYNSLLFFHTGIYQDISIANDEIQKLYDKGLCFRDIIKHLNQKFSTN